MPASTAQRSGGDDRVRPLTKWVSLATIPFLVVAFAVLYPFPHDTARLFAWPIKPTIMPMILASVYIGGAYFFLRAATASQWHTVKGGFVPVGTFATLMGVATILHWDKFSHSHVAFWLWAGLYFTTPFLIFWAWWANRRHDVPATSADPLLPVRVSRVIAVLGALSVLTAIFLFQVAVLMLALILVAGARATGELDPSNAMTWLIGCGFAGVLAAIVILYARMRARHSLPAT
jgi:hypothetical protein